MGPEPRVGRIDKILSRQNIIRIEYSFNGSIDPISPEKIMHLSWELDINDYELARHHWAVKKVDLYQTLAEENIIDAEKTREIESNYSKAIFNDKKAIQIKPKVFNIPQEKQEDNLVAVMMPFKEDFRIVYDSLKKCCKEINLECIRVDDYFHDAAITQDIFRLIYLSKYVICDFTGKNSNVFYEAGIAHTLGKEVIPIVQNPNDIPFDLQSFRHITYLNNSEGIESLKNQFRNVY